MIHNYIMITKNQVELAISVLEGAKNDLSSEQLNRLLDLIKVSGGVRDDITGSLSIEGGGLKDATANLEKQLITRALKQAGGNVMLAADFLKISRKSFAIKMKEFGLAK
ncbi:hypothetical protein KKA95_00195 [Patescibacteria group bacterium]|nr:hypothetical protein [Patescibacteria group bacterium]